VQGVRAPSVMHEYENAMRSPRPTGTERQ